MEIDGVTVRKVEGTTDKFGWGTTTYGYTVYVERGIEIKRREFARQVDAVLADARGWIRGGKVSFQRVENGITRVILARPDSVDKLCYPLDTDGEVSCCQGTKVVLNLARWKNAVPHWPGSVRTYRQMLINHEFGHRIGKGHGWCPGAGKVAPVMQQQTYGLQSCKANSWPLTEEL